MINSRNKNLHPIFDQLLSRAEREERTGQRARCIWFYGLSGSGKSTLAVALDRKLHAEGFFSYVLDGDNVRSGLNKNLGFSDEDREENIRRISEVSRLFVDAGIVAINSFITPRRAYRETARQILGEDLIEVYVRCSYEACAERDVKGLYAKAKAGNLQQFTGKDSSFEEPVSPDLLIDTEKETAAESLATVQMFVLSRIRRTS
ncbi:MAG: adenylyl-sulfate kinase [Opitutales bacterium]